LNAEKLINAKSHKRNEFTQRKSVSLNTIREEFEKAVKLMTYDAKILHDKVEKGDPKYAYLKGDTRYAYFEINGKKYPLLENNMAERTHENNDLLDELLVDIINRFITTNKIAALFKDHFSYRLPINKEQLTKKDLSRNMRFTTSQALKVIAFEHKYKYHYLQLYNEETGLMENCSIHEL